MMKRLGQSKKGVVWLCLMILGNIFFPISVQAQNLYQTEFQAKDALGIYSRVKGIGAESTEDKTEAGSTEQATETSSTESTATERKPTTQATTCVLTKGMKETYYLNMTGSVKWSVSNKKIVKLTKKSNRKCIIKGLKNGTATITAKTKTQTLKIKVSVKSGDAFVNAWCKNWVKVNIDKSMSKYDRVLLASYYMNVYFDYDQTSSVQDVIVNKRGTCVSGGRLLVKLLNKMGFSAKLRFAANDKMSRYPAGIYFASQHHNVQVKINKKDYYVDGTPATGFIYLSSAKKPLYCAFILEDGVMPVLDEIHK